MPKPNRLPLPADAPILAALGRYGYLTADQVRRLRYGPGVITYVRGRLRRLVDAGLVARLEQPHFGPAGSAPGVFRLTGRGRRFARALGVNPVRLPDERPASYLYYAHTLALNDALVAAELLVGSRPRLSLERLVHERELKRAPVAVRLASGAEVSVVPDAYLRLHEREPGGPGYLLDLIWELDMGTTEQRAFRRKVAALVAYGLGPYREALGADSITIVLLAPGGERRAAELLGWVEDELAELDRRDLGGWFCVRGADPAAVRPEELYLAPAWRQPFRADRVALLALADAPLGEGPA